MKISLVTVCYNASKTIADAMESVLGQQLCGFAEAAKRTRTSGESFRRSGKFLADFELEYIIVDGGSTDGTVEMIRAFEQRVRREARPHLTVKWISERDKGLYDAMNKGIRMATGEVVGILNADDMLNERTVLGCVAWWFGQDSRLDVVYSDVRFVNADVSYGEIGGAVTKRYISASFWEPAMLRRGIAPPHPGMYIKKRCFEDWGGYRLDYPIGADYEMTVRFLRRNRARAEYMARCAVAMRAGGVSTRRGLRNFMPNNIDVVRANRDNGYFCTMLLLLGKIPVRVMEVVIPRIKRCMGG